MSTNPPASAPNAIPLPPGWSTAQDQHGRTFYFNAATNESSWTPPAAPPAPSKTVLPPGWEEAVDAQTGRVFYVDHVHKVTQWSPPTGSYVAVPRPVQSAYAPNILQQSAPVGGPANLQPSLSGSWVAPGTPLPSPYIVQQPGTSPAKPILVQGGPAPSPIRQPIPPGASAPPSLMASAPIGGYAPLQQMPGMYPPGTVVTLPPNQMAYNNSFASYPNVAYVEQAAPQPVTLAASKPTWATVERTTCVKCNTTFAFFKRKRTCRCCLRDFCDSCCSKQFLIQSVNTKEKSKICDSCNHHLSNNEKRCFSRLVPYLSEAKEETKAMALQEMWELMQTTVVAAEDILGTGCIPEFKALLKTKHIVLVARILMIAVSYKADPPVSAAFDGPFLETIQEAISTAQPNIPDVIEDLLTVLTRAAEAEKSRSSINAEEAVKVCAKLLEASEDRILTATLRFIELLSSPTFGKPLAQDTESTLVFTVSPLIGSKSPAVCSTAISVMHNLVLAHEPSKAAFGQSGGLKTLITLLPTLTENNLQKALAILVQMTQTSQCSVAVADTIPTLIALVSNASGGVQHLALSVIVNLSHADATQRPANDTLLLDHIKTIVNLLASPDPISQRFALELLVSINMSHGEILAGTLRDSNTLALLFPIAAAPTNPNRLQSIRVLALSSQQNAQNATLLLESRFLDILYDIASSPDQACQLEAMQALWCISAHASVKQAFAKSDNGIRVVVKLLSAPPFELKIAVCGVLANVLTEIACLRRALELNIIEILTPMLSTQVEDLQIQILRVFEVIFEDAAAREIAAKTNLLSIIFTLLSSKNPAVNYRCATTLSILVQSDAVRIAVIKVGNLLPLVNLLSFEDAIVKERVAKALAYFTLDDSDRAYVRAARGIAAFVELLFIDDPRLQKHAAFALANFAFAGTQDCTEILNLGGVLNLVHLLGGDATKLREGVAVDDINAVKAAAASALGNLCADQSCREAAYAEGALGLSIGLLQATNEELVQQVLWLLSALAVHPAVPSEFEKANGFNQLVGLLNSSNSKIRENAVKVALVLSNTESAWDSLSMLLGIKGLLAFLSSPNFEAQKKAISQLSQLAASPEEMDKIIAENGLPPIVALLSSPNTQIQEWSALAVANFSRTESTWEPIVAFGGVYPLVAMLASNPPTCVSASIALAELSKFPPSHKAMTEAGAIPKLLDLLVSPITRLQYGSLQTLANLLRNQEVAVAVQVSGAVPQVALLLSATDPEVRDTAVLVTKLLSAHDGIRPSLISDVFIEPLSNLFTHSAPSQAADIAEIFINLSREHNFVTILESTNFVTTICKTIISPIDPQSREKLLSVLAMASRTKQCKRAVLQENLVPFLLEQIRQYSLAESSATAASEAPKLTSIAGYTAAMEIIANLLSEAACQEAAIQANMIPIIIQLAKLHEGRQEFTDHATRALASLCLLAQGRKLVMQLDGVSVLRDVFYADSGTSMIHALTAINSLMIEPQGRNWFTEHSLIPKCISLLISPSVSPGIRCIVLVTLKILSLYEDNAAALLTDGGQEAIIKQIPLLSGTDQYAAFAALDTLLNLLHHDENRKAAELLITREWLASVNKYFLFQVQQVARLAGVDL